MQKTAAMLLMLLVLNACAHGAKRIECEKHLTAINPPTPKAKAP